MNNISWGQRFQWSVRRELWEHRWVYIAPLTVAGLFLLGFFIGKFGFHKTPADASSFDLGAGLIMATTFVVGIFYSLDALHGERRDRSILFWKSLPISDFTAVLSKAMIPIVILPLVTFVITVAMQTIMLIGSPIDLVTMLHMWIVLFYHLMTVHALWYAPIFCWLLLASVWARRAPLLWAAVPLIAIVFIEKIAFNTYDFRAILGSRLTGDPGTDPFLTQNPAMHLMHLEPQKFLVSAGLWIGLFLAAVFLTTAVRLRRYRGPI